MNQPKQQGQQINIELGEKEAEGIYSNLAIITHSPAEFIIDFTRINSPRAFLPLSQKPKSDNNCINPPYFGKTVTYKL